MGDPTNPDHVPPPRRTGIFLQNDCYQHRYIRSRDTSAIVEKPERLRAVLVGLSAAIARLEDSALNTPKSATAKGSSSAVEDSELDLIAALDRMNIVIDPDNSRDSPVSIVQSSASVDILNNPAVKFIHGDVDGDVYLENLKNLARDSQDKIAKGDSEIPPGLSQGDLYLCPDSINAIQGAIGTVCEAVDTVIASSRRSSSINQTAPELDPQISRAFVAIRPPGHHCGEDTPCGFCFVNNVAIAAAHAHLQHGINRIVIFDIDLHHGNGTQSIIWQINEETYRQTLESEGGGPVSKSGPQIYYGSVHDILSYPCEDGKPALVQAASTSLHGSHGQYIENIHLQTYTSEEHFWNVLYYEQYGRLLRKAEEFLDQTGGPGDDILVFISCGFDACEHEYASMSRHNRKVPTSLYHRFARDACAFSDRYAQGRLVSVLEGGYSDRALISGAMAHLSGLVDVHQLGKPVDEEWWNLKNLVKLEKATKKRRGTRPSLPPKDPSEPWLERAVTIFSSLDTSSAQYTTPSSSRTALPLPPTSMILRERKKPSSSSPGPSPSAKLPKAGSVGKAKGRKSEVPEASQSQPQKSTFPAEVSPDDGNSSSSSTTESSESEPPIVPKKLPRVILRLGPPPGSTGS